MARLAGRLGRSLAGARGDRASQVPRAPAALLDNFGHMPAFAGWVGGRLYGGYAGPIIRIRRASDDAEINVGTADYSNRTDLAAIAAHCAGTTGYLKTVYDQSGNGLNASQTTAAKQQVVYESDAPVTGANGLLAIRYDTAKDSGYATPALGLTGSPALTLAFDVARIPAGAGPYMTAGITNADRATPVFLPDVWFDPGNEHNSYVAATSYSAVLYPGANYADTRFQFSRAANATLDLTDIRIDGATATVVRGEDEDLVVGATDVFVLGADTWVSGDVKLSFGFLWNATLNASEQLSLDAWMGAHHA